MGWIREDDVLKRIEPAGAEADWFCFFHDRYEFVVDVENDATVGFLHDLKDLVDEYAIGGRGGAAIVDGAEIHLAHVLQNLLTAALHPRNENARIHGDVAVVRREVGTNTDVQAHIEAAVSRIHDHRECVIDDPERASATEVADMKNSHAQHLPVSASGCGPNQRENPPGGQAGRVISKGDRNELYQ